MKDAKFFDRKSGGSFRINPPGSPKNNPIYCLLPLEGKLFAFSKESITQIRPAEEIDPENTEPNTRHSYQKCYSIGTSNPIVARTIIQAHEILKSVILREGLDKKEILNHVWKSASFLFSCEGSFHSIFKETSEMIHECKKIIDEGKTGVIASLPQVTELEQRVSTFLGYAKRFLEKTFELLCIFYDSPNFEANFENYRDWISANQSITTEISHLLENDKDWIRQIAWSRNALDINHSKPDFKLEIQNFKLHPRNKFSIPSWKYDFSGKSAGDAQSEFSDIIKDMGIYKFNLLTFFEELFVLSVRDNFHQKWGFEIRKILHKDIKQNCPIKYFVTLSNFPSG